MNHHTAPALEDLASEVYVLTDEDYFFPEDWADYQDERECEWEAEQQLAYWD